jgi:hydrogenase maturation protease
MTPARLLVIGVGNAERGDDAAGLAALRGLRARLGSASAVELCEASGEASALLELWRGRAHVLLLDAACAGHKPGTLMRIDARREALPAGRLHGSTHAWGVAEAVELARALDELPQQMTLYLIEARSFHPGHGLSPEVADAVQELVELLLASECAPRAAALPAEVP